MRCLVTGATGFIGKSIAKRLQINGHHVIGTSSGGSVAEYCNEVLHCGLNGIDWRRIHSVDVVFHQAANNDTRCMDEQDMFHTNVHASVKLLEEAYESGCRRFVYASSTAVYGDSPGPYVEQTPLTGKTPYARSKIAMEEALAKYGRDGMPGMEIFGLRYCNVFGPGEAHKGKRMSMIGQMIQHALARKPISLFFDGSQKRDWIYIDDVVDANLAAASTDYVHPYHHTVMNIGTGVATSFIDLWTYVTELTGYKSPPNWISNSIPNGEFQNHTQCDISFAKSVLNWEPKYLVRQGIQEYLKGV